ncbi:MAG: hypothetical protein P4M00_16370 [Azospirillaceae bacterium]|nr:hypothetical protein [Azospirillaceae bacterium]
MTAEKLRQAADIMGSVGENVFQQAVLRRKTAVDEDWQALLGERDVEQRALLLARMERKAEVQRIVAVKAGKAAETAATTRKEVEAALMLADSTITAINEGVVRDAARALWQTVVAAWQAATALSDPVGFEAGIAAVRPLAAALVKCVTRGAPIAERLAELKHEIDGAPGTKVKLSAQLDSIQHALGKPANGASPDALGKAFDDAANRIAAAFANIEWVGKGQDDLLDDKAALLQAFSMCRERIAKLKVEVSSSLKPVKDHFEAYNDRFLVIEKAGEKLFGALGSPDLASGMATLKVTAETLKQEIDVWAPDYRASDEVVTQIVMATKFASNFNIRGNPYFSDASKDRLTELEIGFAALATKADFPAFHSAALALRQLAVDVRQDVEDTGQVPDLSSKIRIDLEEAAGVTKKIKVATARVPLQAALARLEDRKAPVVSIADPTEKRAALETLLKDAEAFLGVAKEASERFEEIGQLEHDIKTKMSTLGETVDTREIATRLAALTDTKAGRLRGETIEALKVSFVAFHRDLKRVFEDLDALSIRSIDVVAETRELARLDQMIRAVVESLAHTPVPQDLQIALDVMANRLGKIDPTRVEDREVSQVLLADGVEKARNALQQARALKMREVLAQPGGVDAIDQQISDMHGTTVDRDSEILCRAAIEVRFGKTIKIAPGLQTRKLPKLYTLLNAVPVDHVALNRSLEVIEFKTEPRDFENYYMASKKKIAFNAMDENDDLTPYQPDRGDAVNPTYYDSTTLHEVGHAVDDKAGFMEGKKGLAKYGNWKKETREAVIAAHGKDFFSRFTPRGATEADLTVLLTAVLDEAPLVKPAGPQDRLGSLRGQWNAILADPTVTACKRIVMSQTPWYGGKVLARSITVGGRVYQESYEGQWVSYAFDEREATGVSEYQWRAPGEWFAELYAIYYLHPEAMPDIPLREWLDAQTPL